MQVLLFLFLILTVLFIIVATKLQKTSNKLRKLENKIKQINEDRNMLLTKLLQEQEESSKEKIAHISKSIYDNNPSEALDFLEKMVTSQNQIIRTNVVYALIHNLVPETLDMLLRLYEDTNHKVKAEVLKYLKELSGKIERKELTLSPSMENKIKNILTSEKSRKEWII